MDGKDRVAYTDRAIDRVDRGKVDMDSRRPDLSDSIVGIQDVHAVVRSVGLVPGRDPREELLWRLVARLAVGAIEGEGAGTVSLLAVY